MALSSILRKSPATTRLGSSRPFSLPIRVRRHAITVPRAASPSGDVDMQAPKLTFPDQPWQWQRAPPKASLTSALPKSMAWSAAAWVLNLIETIHWASFPLGFYVVHYIFVNTEHIAPHVGGDLTRVFLMVLGLLCQVFGGGISGNMMHTYEGWQVTPFRNPLALPADHPAVPQNDVDQIRVPDYNNAWLRAVAYQMLFSFQALGLGCFTAAAFGINAWTVALLLGSSAIAILGPHTPRPDFRVNGQPILPLSWSLLVVFAINVVANLAGYHALFGAVIAGWLTGVPASIASWLPLLAPLCVAFGGAWEGAVAESTFNQWQHFIAFVVLLAGLALHLVLYTHLAASPIPLVPLIPTSL